VGLDGPTLTIPDVLGATRDEPQVPRSSRSWWRRCLSRATSLASGCIRSSLRRCFGQRPHGVLVIQGRGGR